MLIGRRTELAHLHERRREASLGRGGLVLICGEAGIGKTRLLAEFKASLASARVRVTAAQCRQYAGRPYGPILDSLGRIDAAAAKLEPAASRAEQFERISSAYLTASRRGAVVVLLEDLQWTDPATLELLATLAAAASSERLLFVATYRTGAMPESDPLFAAIGRLGSLRGASTVELDELQRPELAAFIENALEGLPEVAQGTRKEIARLSEGNPLFAEELMKNALDRKRAGATRSALPTTIRAAVRERLAPLGPEDFDVLAHAAVVGRQFGATLLATAIDLPRARVERALQRARALQLIVEERSGEFRFRHALTRETIYEDFLGVQLRALHRRIAAALEELPGREHVLQALAYHWWAADEGLKAVEYAERAGDEAMSVFAYEEAIRFFGYAADFVPHHSAAGAALRRKIMRALTLNGERGQALRVGEETAAILERLGDLAQECDVRIDWAVESYNLGLPDATAPLVAMLPRLEPPEHAAIRSRLEITRAQLLAIAGREDEALAILASLGSSAPGEDRTEQLSYFATKALVCQRRADIDGFLENTNRMLAIATDERRLAHRAMTLSNMAGVLTRVGRLDGVEGYLAEAVALARPRHFQAQLAIALAYSVALHYRRGEFREAKSAANQVLEIETDHTLPGLHLAAYGCAIGLLTGDDDLVARCYDEARAARNGQIGLVGFAYAERSIANGNPDEARRLLARALRSSGGTGMAPFDLYLAVARWGAEADLELARTELESARAVNRHSVHGGILALFDAYVAARSLDNAAARRLGAEAAAAFGALGLPLWEADALRLAGQVESAREIYARIGAVARLRELERRAAGEPSASATAAREGVFTSREREVAELVGAGLSNAEIAHKLGVTVKAVEKHLGAIYKKLDFSSRSKLIVYMQAH
jgi:ATP/maltotriose-dependent transcriptional regulator MalT